MLLLRLVDKYMSFSAIEVGGSLSSHAGGTRIRSPVADILSVVYLNVLDKLVKQFVAEVRSSELRVARFVDDSLLFETFLHKCN